MESESRLRHMQVVFDWLKTIPGAEDRFRDAVFVIPSATLLHKAVESIDKLFVTDQNYDTLGDIYEYLLSEIAESGKNGQFRTPRHIIRAMIDMVNPVLGESICDPACGTGGFLVNSLLHIRKTHTDRHELRFEANGAPINALGLEVNGAPVNALGLNLYFDEGRIRSEAEVLQFFEPTLFGYDFDRTMVRLGWMNLIQHGLREPQIAYDDTLGSRFNEKLADGSIGQFNVVLANPPFTGSIDKENIGKTLQGLGTTKTELLFVELILQLLREGGRAAVIVPEGLLFGSTKAHVALRRRLLDENQLNAVISLPGGVFQPYTGVKTSILLFARGSSTNEVWFYEVQADGYSLDAKRDRRPQRNDLWDMTLKYHLRFGGDYPPAFLDDETLQATGIEGWTKQYLQPVIGTAAVKVGTDNVDTPMLQGFNIVHMEEPRDWTASAEEIRENDYNLSAGRYKPFRLAAAEFESPREIIKQLQAIEGEIQAGLDRLLELVSGDDA